MSAGAEWPARACPQGPSGRQAPAQAQGPASRKRGATAGHRREQKGGGPPARALELGRHWEPAPAALRAGAAGRPRADPPSPTGSRCEGVPHGGVLPPAHTGTLHRAQAERAPDTTCRRRAGPSGRAARGMRRRRPAEPRGRPGRRPKAQAWRMPARAVGGRTAAAPPGRRAPRRRGPRYPAVFVGESPLMAESNNRIKLTGAAEFFRCAGFPGSPESG